MADKSLKLSIVIAAQDLASGKLDKVRTELAGMGKAGAVANAGLGRLTGIANRASGAFGTLRSRIGGAASTLGSFVGIGGVLGVTKLLGDSITKAESFGVATQKLVTVTNMAAEEASGYVDVLDKYGVSADQAVQITGLLLKNYAGLMQSTKKAAAFEAQYGVSLRKANGQQLTAAELLDKTNEFFNSGASATDKAAFAAKLYGRNWQQLLPILSLTRAEFKKQNDEALKLTPQQLKAALELKKAQQDFNDELGDTETLVGIEILPSITKLVKSIGQFLTSHKADIINAVNGGVALAGQIADAFGAVVSGLSGAWNAIPAPLRDLLLKGFVADRTIKFLFGFDPAKAILSGITGLFSKVMGIRASVVNVSGGTVTGTGGVAGTGTGKGGSKLGNAVAAVSIVGDAFALWQQWTQTNEQSTAQANDLQAQTNKWLQQQPKRDDLVRGLAAVDQGIADIRNNPLLTLVQGEALNRLQSMDGNIRAQIAAIDSLKPHIDALQALKIAVSVSGLTGNTGRSRTGGGEGNRGGGSGYVDKGGGRGGGRASGGPVWPGTWTVGERGMEILRLGANGQGYVTPVGGRQGVSVTIVNRPPGISAREVMNADRQWRRVTSGNGSGVTIR